MTTSDAQTRLLKGLNEDLRGEFQAIIMYRLYASMVQGPYRQELRNFFAAEIPEELNHAQMLADKIAALGGTPVATPAPVTVVSDAKAMLEARCWRVGPNSRNTLGIAGPRPEDRGDGGCGDQGGAVSASRPRSLKGHPRT